jgi:dihydrofolate reductase
MAPLSIILAVDQNAGFSKNGTIPWITEPFAKDDLAHFQKITKNHICVMGRKTYEDMVEIMEQRGKNIAEIKDILPNRQSYVLSRNPNFNPIGAKRAESLRQVINNLDDGDHRTVFIIGGEKLFIEAIPWTHTIHMSIVKNDYKCDKAFPLNSITKKFVISEGHETDNLYFIKYTRVRD